MQLEPTRMFGLRGGIGVWPRSVHPALRGLGVECGNVCVRLLAYFGGLLVLAVIAADLVTPAVKSESAAAHEKSRWLSAVRPYPSFSVPLEDLSDKSINYDILRHAEGGGRRDVLTWTLAQGGPPIARIEIYRPGGEAEAFGEPGPTLAQSAGLRSAAGVVPAGMIDSKFGRVPLFTLDPSGTEKSSCIGFLTAMETPKLQISGWFCPQDKDREAREVAACAIDRLTLLSSGNDAGVAALFARAELRRGLCDSSGAVRGGPADWVTALNGPKLRGGI